MCLCRQLLEVDELLLDLCCGPATLVHQVTCGVLVELCCSAPLLLLQYLTDTNGNHLSAPFLQNKMNLAFCSDVNASCVCLYMRACAVMGECSVMV